MSVVKVAEGAFSVPSYSEQTITPSYTVGTTLQSFGGAVILTDCPRDARAAEADASSDDSPRFLSG